MVVFGGSGGLGSPLSESLGKEYNIKSLSSREVDVTSFSEVKLFFEAHKPRVIINLSGYSYNTVLHKYDGEDLHLSKQIKVNIEGNLNILGCCLPYMREAGYGRIILASSVLSSRPAFGTGVYSGCKAFIDNLVKTCSIENLDKGITCNSLQLGYMDGGLTYQVPEKFRNIVKDRIPLKRWGHISEIENAIRYLINTEYVSGCSLKINGGLEF
tara:strand:+ start:1134 stop:1772 length:639 start_codon:yes stop_codon:yes gene_type:complete